MAIFNITNDSGKIEPFLTSNINIYISDAPLYISEVEIPEETYNGNY